MTNMNFFQLTNNENCIYFSNQDRIDEKTIFNGVLEGLKNDKSFKIKNKLKGPYEDIYRCSIGNHNFDLILDIDYGTFIKSTNRVTIEYLKAYLIRI